MAYLITGATGNVGGRVVEQLLTRGERPRIFVRDAAKARARFGEHVEIAAGDLADSASLSAALAGVEALLLINLGQDLAARDAAAASAAKAAGVRHIVKLSSLDARRAGSSAVGTWHACGEAAIRDSGVGFTFVQPGGFMSNALAWAPSIRAQGTISASTGEGKLAMIHPDDIAAVTTTALTTRAYVGAALPITGPEALSYGQMAEKLGAALGRKITFYPISDEQARTRLLANGLTAALADALVALWQGVREGRAETVTDTVARVLGRRPLGFDEWVAQNIAAFGAAGS